MTKAQTDGGYAPYLEARAAVRRMKATLGSSVADPSSYWAEELSNIDYMIEASPLLVRKLRHHAFQITGIRPYDYRKQDDARRHAFESRLHALIELGGKELIVPEHEALGGFGYRLPGGLFNLDTIKYLEVLVGMKRAGVLQALGSSSGRPTVLEIGGGWGGFAYQVKTLFPDVRYLIVDFPELFLFSATYLRTVFPKASVAFVDPESSEAPLVDADFVFVPNTLADRVAKYSPDILINVASFQEMTAEQVSSYAALAHRSGCRNLYSLNRERSSYNDELSSISECLAPYYALKGIEVLDTDYVKAMKKPRGGRVSHATAKTDGRNQLAYRHLVGVRRDQVAEPRPTFGIGLTAHNRAPYLRSALDSLLGQTRSDFQLVIVDDGSVDETSDIGREYVARDPRVRYVRQDKRRGMTATWRVAFEEATRLPSVRFFAWASDHDVWHPSWLATLARALEQPGVLLAYSYSRRIDERGDVLPKPPRRFETSGMSNRDDRWRYACQKLVAAGDMVYGLMEVDAVRQAGVFRDVLCPDRLLMAELALQGEFRQVPEELWFRRQFGESESSIARQRKSLFADQVPHGSRFPPWVQHGWVLWRAYVRSASTRKEWRRRVSHVLRYCLVYALKHHKKTIVYRQSGAIFWAARKTWKRTKHHTLLAVFYALVYTRRAYRRSVFEVLTFTKRIGLR